MIRIEDPRTGEAAPIADHKAYTADMAAARRPPCTHPTKELRRWTNANGAVVIQGQCLVCGARDGNQVKVTDRAAYPEADPALRREWQEADLRAIYDVRIRHIDMTAQRLSQQGDFYREYIASDAWRSKRAKVLKRCGGLCEGCGEARATQVHHLTYDHLGDELLFELVGLCEPCHVKAHGPGFPLPDLEEGGDDAAILGSHDDAHPEIDF